MDDEWTFCDSDACDKFKSKVITNGDKIIAGGVRALAKFYVRNTCDTCIYSNKSKSHNDICHCPVDKVCSDGIIAWLNAPAESEVSNE